MAIFELLARAFTYPYPGLLEELRHRGVDGFQRVASRPFAVPDLLLAAVASALGSARRLHAMVGERQRRQCWPQLAWCNSFTNLWKVSPRWA